MKTYYIHPELSEMISAKNAPNYDGRRRLFRLSTITREEYNDLIRHMYDVAVMRARNNNMHRDMIGHRIAYINRQLEYFRCIPYLDEFIKRYGAGETLTDWEKYQQPIADGYAAICPGEPANSVRITDDPVLIHILMLRYCRHYANK
jgi:hypothetical protein